MYGAMASVVRRGTMWHSTSCGFFVSGSTRTLCQKPMTRHVVTHGGPFDVCAIELPLRRPCEVVRAAPGYLRLGSFLSASTWEGSRHHTDTGRTEEHKSVTTTTVHDHSPVAPHPSRAPMNSAIFWPLFSMSATSVPQKRATAHRRALARTGATFLLANQALYAPLRRTPHAAPGSTQEPHSTLKHARQCCVLRHVMVPHPVAHFLVGHASQCESQP